MLTANMKIMDSKLTISQDQHEELVETVTRANALTQVLLTIPTENIELIPTRSLYNFVMVLNDLIYQANQLCRAIKPQSWENK